MPHSLQVIYENGVLRPLEPLLFEENQLLTVTVTEPEDGDWIDVAFLRCVETQADDSVTLDSVRSALSKIPGSMVEDFRAERDERI